MRHFLLTAVLLLSACVVRDAVRRVDLAEGCTEKRDLAYWAGDDFDTQKHRLNLFVPKGPGPHPIFFFVHGGGWVFGDRNQSLDPYVKLGRRMAARGFLTAVISYRLGPDFKHPAEVTDTARAAAWTLKHAAEYGGDPSRFFVAGHSAGAHLVSLLATDPRFLRAQSVEPAQLSAVIAVSPPVDIEKLGRSTLLVGLPMVFRAFGTDPEVWKDASPANHLRDLKSRPPFFIAYGDADFGPVRDQAPVFQRQLTRSGTRAELRMTDLDDHFSIITNFGAHDDPLADAVEKFLSTIGKNTFDAGEAGP